MDKKDAPLLAIIALLCSLVGVGFGSFPLLIIAIVCSVLSESHLYAKIAFVISICYLIFLVLLFFGMFAFFLSIN